ncbi:hypothetical protein E3P92_03451 [Wallemia ichthyophaga]|nr:hypothetical protein E3P98_00148 [Wallemia ichthyophaga]TIA88639.1 hypothetical protein E3P97_03454 [Wallemia ichthyophaga]TIB05185.1 hypothetical protein E3P96_01332 [Wallemia ichthyophaga]TIB09482.1 hypothetical protein E3P92_03451 [Wallemia ichthyophaga]TIB27819.1 hypothetical protein E3P85_04042 [Wallemia ichthyophaga]
MGLADYLSSAVDAVYSVGYADEGEEQPQEQPQEETQEEPQQESEDKEEEEEEEEEEEPEDIYPAIREECENNSHVAHLKHHFEHCNEKVEAGKGFEGENCAEEMRNPVSKPQHAHTPLTPYSFLHAVDDCAAPKLFTKLV